MVRWSLAAQVSRVDIEALLHEVEHRDRLITLRADVHHINAALVLSANIRPMLDKQTNQVQIAMEAREVQRCERVLPLCMLVQPEAQMVAPQHQSALFFRLCSIRAVFCSIVILRGSRNAFVFFAIQHEVDQDFARSILALICRQVNRCEATWIEDLGHIQLLCCLLQVPLELFRFALHDQDVNFTN